MDDKMKQPTVREGEGENQFTATVDNNNLNYVCFTYFAVGERAMERETIALIICERIANALFGEAL